MYEALGFGAPETRCRRCESSSASAQTLGTYLEIALDATQEDRRAKAKTLPYVVLRLKWLTCLICFLLERTRFPSKILRSLESFRRIADDPSPVRTDPTGESRVGFVERDPWRAPDALSVRVWASRGRWCGGGKWEEGAGQKGAARPPVVDVSPFGRPAL
ncbi:hypothetical protein B0H17DRAFT_41324 [Mycena rosella]|uniref:Uncharacterized protein n=1 Tax=Mycena rosella TaxID=1033263 RepID=A0AAD7D7G0_MYCRO|nr:hypothetical protein B0H17DRAFT_41324 [Mycena rosella]